MNQLYKNIIALSIVVLLVVGAGVVYFEFRDSSNTNGGVVIPEEVNFRQTGNLFKDNPGVSPGVWYLSYGEPGKPGLKVELQFTNEMKLVFL